MKRCPKCETEKETTEFYKNKRTKDGLKSWCKECHLNDSRSREEKYNETRRKYREEHKEESREKKRVYYNNNKEKILEDNRQWRQTFKGRLLSYMRSATKRDIPWLLSEGDFLNPNEMRAAYRAFLKAKLLMIDTLVKEAEDAR